ncbi:MAG: type II secretion system protein N [Hyphomonadaceae bacterium]|nr:type II secretion system protein N [Hyphomonadaceae bacterium]
MSIKLWHVLVFVFALVVFALAGAPARVLAPQHPGAFTYERADGTVWRGRLEAVRVGALSAGSLSWRIALFDVLQGKIDAPIGISGGDVAGEGRLLANLQGDRRLMIAQLRIDGMPLGAAMLPGQTQIEGVDVFFDAGQCVQAEGRATSDVLQRAGQTLRFDGPALAGAMRCDGADALLELTGTNVAGDSALVTVRLRGDGSGEWRVGVRSASIETQAALVAAGLTADPVSGETSISEGMTWLPF